MEKKAKQKRKSTTAAAAVDPDFISHNSRGGECAVTTRLNSARCKWIRTSLFRLIYYCIMRKHFYSENWLEISENTYVYIEDDASTLGGCGWSCVPGCRRRPRLYIGERRPSASQSTSKSNRIIMYSVFFFLKQVSLVVLCKCCQQSYNPPTQSLFFFNSS